MKTNKQFNRFRSIRRILSDQLRQVLSFGDLNFLKYSGSRLHAGPNMQRWVLPQAAFFADKLAFAAVTPTILFWIRNRLRPEHYKNAERPTSLNTVFLKRIDLRALFFTQKISFRSFSLLPLVSAVAHFFYVFVGFFFVFSLFILFFSSELTFFFEYWFNFANVLKQFLGLIIYCFDSLGGYTLEKFFWYSVNFHSVVTLTDFFSDFLSHYLQLFFKTWEDQAYSWEFFYQVDFLALYWLFTFFLLFYVACLLNIARIVGRVLFSMRDSWVVLLRLFYGIDFFRSVPDIAEISQTFEDGDLLVALKSSSLYYGNRALTENQARFLYDYNLTVGFGGYVGFMNFFPSYTSTFDVGSAAKTRARPSKFLADDGVYFFFSSLRALKLSTFNAAGLWRQARYRFTYLTAKKNSTDSSILSDLFTIPRFKFVFTKNLLIQVIVFLTSAVSKFGDLDVARLRELYFYHVTSNRELFSDNPFSENSEPLAATMLGSSIDWYHKELSAVILSRTVQRKAALKTKKLFNFGVNALINNYSFWATELDLEANSSSIFEDELFVQHEHEDETTAAIEQKEFAFSVDMHAQFLGERPEAFFETDDEALETPFDANFEDGFLHNDVDSILFEDETLEYVDEGMTTSDAYDDNDEEIIDLFSSPALAYGAGQEEDYLLLQDKIPSPLYGLNYVDTTFAEAQGVFSSFYEDIGDHLWILSSASSYKNFLEYPTHRFFNPILVSSELLFEKSIVTRLWGGRLLTFFYPFFYRMLIPQFDRFRADLFVNVLVILAVLTYVISLFLILTFFEVSFIGLPLIGWLFGLLGVLLLMLFGALFFVFNLKNVAQLLLKSLLSELGAFLTLITIFVAVFCRWKPYTYSSSAAVFSNRLALGRNFSFNFARLSARDAVVYGKYRSFAVSVLGYRFNWAPRLINFFYTFNDSASFQYFSKFWIITDLDVEPFSFLMPPSDAYSVMSLPDTLKLNPRFSGLEYHSSAKFFCGNVHRMDSQLYLTLGNLSNFKYKLLGVLVYSKLNVIFEDLSRIKKKKQLTFIRLTPNSQLTTLLGSTGHFQKPFFDAAVFYSVLEKKSFLLHPITQKSLIAGEPTELDSWVSLDSKKHPTVRTNRSSTNFDFFSPQSFEEYSVSTSNVYSEFARLFLAETYFLRNYSARLTNNKIKPSSRLKNWFVWSRNDALTYPKTFY